MQRACIKTVVKSVLGAGAVAAALAFGASQASAQGYPERAVTLVAPQAVGGAADLAARAFAVVAEKYLGQPIRVVNTAGGAGVPGMMSVATAAPDGYTMLAPMAPFALSGPVFRAESPYQTFDFDYIAILEEQPLVLAVQSDSEITDAQMLVDSISSGSGELKVAVGSQISLATLVYRALVIDTGAPESATSAVPYRSGPDSVRGLLAGDVEAASINLSSINAALRSGDARLLMVTTAERNEAYPDAVTAKELGLQTVDGITLWIGLSGPKGLPEEVKEKWTEVVGQVFADPEYIKLVNQRGSEVANLSGADAIAEIEAQLQTFQTLKAALEN